MSSYFKETKKTESILNNFIHINESLPQNIIEYLKSYKLKTKSSNNLINQSTRNINNSTILSIYSGTTETTKMFDMLTFCNLIKLNTKISNNNISKNNLKISKTPINVYKLNDNPAISLSNKNLHEVMDNRMNNFHRFNSSPQNIFEFSRKQARSKTTQTKSKATIIDINEKNNLSFNEYTYLGIVKVKQFKYHNGINSGSYQINHKELHVYFRSDDNILELEFLIEDLSNIINKERKETVMTCRSLYLSKISHEFKNPICNILEICSYIQRRD